METQKKKRKPMKQGYKILLGVAIGALIGILFGEKATILKPIGTIYLNLMYCSLIPLVFFSISSSVANLKSRTCWEKCWYPCLAYSSRQARLPL